MTEQVRPLESLTREELIELIRHEREAIGAGGVPLMSDAKDAEIARLRRAYVLGQIHWQQADSESWSQNRKSAETEAKFDALIEETMAAISSQPAMPAEPDHFRDAAKMVPDPLQYSHDRNDHYVTGWNDCVAAMVAGSQLPDSDS